MGGPLQRMTEEGVDAEEGEMVRRGGYVRLEAGRLVEDRSYLARCGARGRGMRAVLTTKSAKAGKVEGWRNSSRQRAGICCCRRADRSSARCKENLGQCSKKCSTVSSPRPHAQLGEETWPKRNK